MRHPARGSLFPGLLLYFVGAALTPGAVRAEDPAESVRARLDRLESKVKRLDEENEELRKAAKAAAPKDEKNEAKKDEQEKAEAPEPTPKEKAGEVGSDRKMSARWNNGVVFETADKAFQLTVGGVTQFDMGWFGADKAVVRSVGTLNNLLDPGQSLQDGMDFRRARLRMSGRAFGQIEFFAQYEFANATDLRQRTLGIPNDAGVGSSVQGNFDPAETTGFNEVYVGLVKLPLLGNVRVGRHRESLNFVTATADNNQIWLERGLLFEAFNSNTNFSNGVTVQNTYLDGRAYALFGVFQQNTLSNRQFATIGDGNYAYSTRFTCLPVYNEDDRVWVHLGADYSYRNLARDFVRYRARPDIRIGSAFQVPNLVDSGNLFSRDAQQIVNLEFAAASGPWTFAAEASASAVTNVYTGGLPGPDGRLPEGAVRRGTYRTSGAYVEVLRFLTPDHRPYVKERPGYARVSPASNFLLLEGEDGRVACGWGGWEVGLRYDYVDLTDAGINGGTAQGLTACVNWYLSSNCRVQTNYSHMRRDFDPPDQTARVNGDIRALGVRFNIDF